MITKRTQHLLAASAISLIAAAACGESATPTPDTTTARAPAPGGKGDVLVSDAECRAYFADPVVCPDIDRYDATAEELQESIDCLEARNALPESSCCLKESLQSEPFCEALLFDGALFACEDARDRYQACALSEIGDAAICKKTFVDDFFTFQDFDCCELLDTGLCDVPTDHIRLETLDDIVAPIVDANGYIHVSALSNQIAHVDTMPNAILENLTFYRDPNLEVQNALVTDDVDFHRIKRQLPIQYAVAGFFPAFLTQGAGGKVRDIAGTASAYISTWETTGGQIALMLHYMDPSAISTTFGWARGPAFVIKASVCDFIDTSAPSYGELLTALDEANGYIEESCVASIATSTDPGSITSITSPLRYALNTSIHDSRLDTIRSAYHLSARGFDGYIITLSETLSEEDKAFGFTARTDMRVLVNDHGDVLARYDDDHCEPEAGSVNAIGCEDAMILGD